MTELLRFMEEMARGAGKIQMDRLNEKHDIRFKMEIDLVTEVDKMCEDLIVGAISKKFPDDDVYAEEGSGKRDGTSRRWHVDPLDGTLNYSHGFPIFCVSIALEEAGEIKAGVIYDPNRNELFAAEKGKGATLNGKKIQASDSQTLRNALLATGFACLIYGDKETDNIELFKKFLKKSRSVRRPGSAAVDLAWVACGRLDGFWEHNLKPWDMAAGALIVSEAGGRVSSFSGGKYDLYGTEILVSNGIIHNEMCAVLAE